MSPTLRQYRMLHTAGYKEVMAAIEGEGSGLMVPSVIVEHYRRGVKDLKASIMVKLSAGERSAVEEEITKIRNCIRDAEDRITSILQCQQHQDTKPAGKKNSSPPSQQKSHYTSSSSPSYLRKGSGGGGISGPVVSSSSNNKKSVIPSTVSSSAGVKPRADFLKTVDSAMCEKILNEVLVNKPNVTWEDIVGLEGAKQALKEIVILPALRPDLFTGLRSASRGVLLFGPPGTGKTMLAKAVAHESKCNFFSISASTLTSKFVGEGEKMVRTLFAVARHLSPSIIFIDEIDSILTERSESEHEASRRLKTEFLLQFDGVASNPEEKLLVMGATNRPSELDSAAIRRLVKRIYIPLPEPGTRAALIEHLLLGHKHTLTGGDRDRLVALTEGYSGSDINALAREASLGPIRSLGDKLMSVDEKNIRPISLQDFVLASQTIRPSVSGSLIDYFQKWNSQYGVSG